MGAAVIGGRFMSWLFSPPHRPPRSERLDAALARNLAAQQRAAKEADAVVVAASASRERTAAAGQKIRERIKHRETPSGRREASYARQLVDEVLASMDEQDEGGQC